MPARLRVGFSWPQVTVFIFVATRLHYIRFDSSSVYPDDNIFIRYRAYSIPFIMDFGDLKERIKVQFIITSTNLRLKFILLKFVHSFWQENNFI